MYVIENEKKHEKKTEIKIDKISYKKHEYSPIAPAEDV